MTPLTHLLRPTLTKKDGWREFVNSERPPAPEAPTIADWQRMSAAERAVFDRARMSHLETFCIDTPRMKQLSAQIIPRAIRAVHQQPGVRPGDLVDGLGGLGKSTIIRELGRRFEKQLSRDYPARDPQKEEAEWIPVVYVSVPAAATTKSLNQYIADFYGITYRPNESAEALTRKIRDHAEQCSTVLLLVDDIHFISYSNQSDEHVNNHLKNLANLIPATHVYAGIGCRALLEEGKRANAALSQTRHRLRHWPVLPFERDTPENDREWQQLMVTLERHVVLLNSTKGVLQGLSDYIFDRTNGYIGAVVQLIREGGALAVANESEQITEGLLDEIELDAASEEGHMARRPSTPRSRQRSMDRLRAQKFGAA